MQLDLLTYEPTAEEMTPPTEDQARCGKLQPPINRHAIAWQETKAAFYLQRMKQLRRGSLCRRDVRRAEIRRLHELRQQALEAIEAGQ